MGFIEKYSARICFDIETCPLPEAADYIEPTTAPANYRDPDKINAYIEGGNAAALGKCGLDVDLGQIVAIGTWVEGDSVVQVRSQYNQTEAELLEDFWFECDGLTRHAVGFNVLAFDLPFLLRRSLYLGVQAPHIQIDRFKHPMVTDLMVELSYNGALKYRGLSFYCRRFGINIPDPITGADIAAAVKAEQWGAVEAHVKADVQKTAALADIMGHFNRAVRKEMAL